MVRSSVLVLLTGGALAAAACTQRTIQVHVLGEGSEYVVSLVGDTLRSVPVDPRNGPALVTDLLWARGELAREPNSTAAQLRIARRTARLGRLREAVGILTEAAKTKYTSPSLFRLRGEYLLQLRELDLAIADLKKAELMLPESYLLPELADDTLTTTEPTSLQFQSAMLLGMALYCKGDFARAGEALVRAGNVSESGDELAQAVLWLFFTLRRTNPEEAIKVLDLVTTDWTVSRRRAEYDLLLAYRGVVQSDSIRARALAVTGGDDRALYGYGIGYLLLMQDRKDEAAAWFRQARTIINWTTLPYVAAEAELTRLPDGTGRPGAGQ